MAWYNYIGLKDPAQWEQEDIERKKQAISGGLQALFPDRQVPFIDESKTMGTMDDPLYAMTQYDPMMFVKNLKGIMPETADAVAGAYVADQTGSNEFGKALLSQFFPNQNKGQLPASAIQQHQYWKALHPDATQKESADAFDAISRVNEFQNLGGLISLLNRGSGKDVKSIDKTPPPETQPAYLAEQVRLKQLREDSVKKSTEMYSEIPTFENLSRELKKGLTYLREHPEINSGGLWKYAPTLQPGSVMLQAAGDKAALISTKFYGLTPVSNVDLAKVGETVNPNLPNQDLIKYYEAQSKSVDNVLRGLKQSARFLEHKNIPELVSEREKWIPPANYPNAEYDDSNGGWYIYNANRTQRAKVK